MIFKKSNNSLYLSLMRNKFFPVSSENSGESVGVEHCVYVGIPCWGYVQAALYSISIKKMQDPFQDMIIASWE